MFDVIFGVRLSEVKVRRAQQGYYPIGIRAAAGARDIFYSSKMENNLEGRERGGSMVMK